MENENENKNVDMLVNAENVSRPTEPAETPAIAPAQPAPSSEPASTQEPTLTPESASAPEPMPILESTPTPEPVSTPEPTAASEPALVLEPTAALRPTPTLEPASTLTTEPSLEPAPAISPSPSAESAPSLIKNLLLKAKEKIQFRKRKKLERILALAGQKSNIANQDVEKLLRVSDATATRYLSQLVREGKLKRLGKPARARYEPL